MGLPELAGLGANVIGGVAGGKAAGEGGKKSGPPPQDYMGLANKMAEENRKAVEAQTRANRPNQSSPFASSQWTQGPDGQWSQSLGFNGPLAGLSQSLQQQASQAMSKPFSLEGLPALTDGAGARDQAIASAYGQATSRLDPQWQQREESTRSRLLASGLQEGSEAYNKAFANLGRERNDAYTSAMNSAIGQGTQAGQALFQQSLASRNQGLMEALRERGQAFGELQGMQGLLQMPGFNASGQAQGPQLLQAGGMQDAANFQRWQQQMQMISELIGAGGQLGGAAIMASDERLKQNVERFGFEAIPGVPAAAWNWAPGAGPEGRQYGVVAQDVLAVRPDLVHEDESGMLMVDYGGILGAK